MRRVAPLKPFAWKSNSTSWPHESGISRFGISRFAVVAANANAPSAWRAQEPGTDKPRCDLQLTKEDFMDCPECAKNGKIVAMKKDRGSRPGRRPERAEAVFIEDDMWVCPTCDHVEVVKD